MRTTCFHCPGLVQSLQNLSGQRVSIALGWHNLYRIYQDNVSKLPWVDTISTEFIRTTCFHRRGLVQSLHNLSRQRVSIAVSWCNFCRIYQDNVSPLPWVDTISTDFIRTTCLHCRGLTQFLQNLSGQRISIAVVWCNFCRIYQDNVSPSPWVGAICTEFIRTTCFHCRGFFNVRMPAAHGSSEGPDTEPTNMGQKWGGEGNRRCSEKKGKKRSKPLLSLLLFSDDL